MDQQNQLQESNLSEPDVLSNCSTNDVLADLDHKLKIETESEMPKNRHGLKQSIKILGNGDNALYRLGDKMYLLERIEFWRHAIQIMIVQGDTKRETNFKNEMEIVRRMIFHCFSPAESQPV